MGLGIRLRFDPVRSSLFSGMASSYTPVGTALTGTASQIMVQNLTDALLMFSIDGIHDHFPLPENGFLLLDIVANKTDSQGLFLSKGDRLYVKTIGTPTSGSVYFTVSFGSNE